MFTTYYTVADLSLVPGHLPNPDWVQEEFQTLKEALRHYRSLPATRQKFLGIISRSLMLGLVRCVPRFGADEPGEDVLAVDYPSNPLWSRHPDAIQAAEICIAELNLRYVSEGWMLYPIQEEKVLPSHLQNTLLWLNEKQSWPDSIRWAYLAGTGWIPYRSIQEYRGTYPLILKYITDGITKQGAYLSLELTPWEYNALYFRSIDRKTGGDPV